MTPHPPRQLGAKGRAGGAGRRSPVKLGRPAKRAKLASAASAAVVFTAMVAAAVALIAWCPASIT
jgi:hypothetical protein